MVGKMAGGGGGGGEKVWLEKSGEWEVNVRGRENRGGR